MFQFLSFLAPTVRPLANQLLVRGVQIIFLVISVQFSKGIAQHLCSCANFGGEMVEPRSLLIQLIPWLFFGLLWSKKVLWFTEDATNTASHLGIGCDSPGLTGRPGGKFIFEVSQLFFSFLCSKLNVFEASCLAWCFLVFLRSNKKSSIKSQQFIEFPILSLIYPTVFNVSFILNFTFLFFP